MRFALLLACAAAGLGIGLPAGAQAIDPSIARARLGEPLGIDIRVRHGTAHLGSLAAHCLRATVAMGDTLLEPQDLIVTISPDDRAGWERVRLAHAARVDEPVIDVRLELRCGAEFSRSFPVLVDLQADPIRRAPTPALVRAPQRRPIEMHGAALAALAVPSLQVRSPAADVAAPQTPAAVTDSAVLPGAAALLLDELRRLREDQRRIQTELASLQARLSHRERSWSVADWPWLLSALLALLMLFLLRRVVVHRPRRPRRVGGATEPPVPGPRLSADLPVSPPVEASERANIAPALHAAPPHERRTRWAHADFGQASLDGVPSPAFLREAERYVSEGYPVAAVTLMERALQAQPGKNPWHLLMLLDLYSALHQERNQECVAAQLEALYNVQIPELHGLPIEGRDLLDQTDSLACVQDAWRAPDPDERLATLLLQPVAVEPLDLAAFRDVLLLHEVARQGRSDDGPASPFNPVIDWSPPAA